MKPLLLALSLIGVFGCNKQLSVSPTSTSAIVASDATIGGTCRIQTIGLPPLVKNGPPREILEFKYNAAGLPQNIFHRTGDPHHPDQGNMSMRYDSYGRLVYLNHDSYQRSYYYSGTSTLPYRDSTYDHNPDDGGWKLTYSTFTYDVLGRLATIKKKWMFYPSDPTSIWDSSYTVNTYNSLGDLSQQKITEYSPGGVSVTTTRAYSYSTAKSILKTHRVWQQIYENYCAHERVTPLTVNSSNLPTKSADPRWSFGPDSGPFRSGATLTATYACN